MSMIDINRTEAAAEEIRYTGTNALEVEAWAKHHGYHFTGDWPSESGAPIHLAITYPPEGYRPTSYLVQVGDIISEGQKGPLIDRGTPGQQSAGSEEKPGPKLSPARQQERDDQLRALALQQAVLTFGTPDVSTRDLGAAVRNTAAHFYGFLAGKDDAK